MTMDISSRRSDNKSEVQLTNCEEPSSIPKTVKRSFDVAFLMLPDEKLKQKQRKSASEFLLHQSAGSAVRNNNDEIISSANNEDECSARIIDLQKMKNHARYLHSAIQKHQVFDDPNLIKPKISQDESILIKSTYIPSEQKSAFTKVNLIPKETRASPGLSPSPDLSYQTSLSPSPPITNRNYQILSQNQIFKSQNIPAYQNHFMQENFAVPNAMSLDHPFLSKSNVESFQPNFSKIRPMISQYRHELGYNYQQFQSPDMLKMSQPDLKFPPDIRNPAAAILSSLLPPSLAALSLPAQNVCAKCNISFRMTSDLVYHMRSHHKNDAMDSTRKRREEKLKCPVCAESFRERHHLTRHMTAHQDKDEDDQEPLRKKKDFANFK